MAIVSVRTYLDKYCPAALKTHLAKIVVSDIGHRLVRGAFWSIAAAVVSRGLMLVASVCVARILGKECYGELGMIRSTVGMFGVFAGFGLGTTATKHVAQYFQSDPNRAGRIICLSEIFAMGSGLFIAIGLLLLAPWLSTHTINAPHLTDTLRISALILFFGAINGTQIGTLSGFEAFRTIAQVNLWAGLSSFPILICGAWIGGLSGTVWALAINLAINLLLNHFAVRKTAKHYYVPITLRNCFLEWSILFRFSLPAVLCGALVGPVSWACGALLVNQPEGYSQMGIYDAANQWRIAILFLPSMLGQVILPLLTNLNETPSQHHYQKVIKINLILNIVVTLAIAIPLALLARYVMKTYGPSFVEGSNVLRVLSLSAVLAACNMVIGQAIISKGKMWLGLLFNILWAMSLVSMSALFLFRGYGAQGLAYATLIAYTLHLIWQGIYLANVLNHRTTVRKHDFS